MSETQTTTNAGDAAVDGLLAGIAAGVLMALYLALAGLFSGNGMAVTLGLFTPFGPPSPLLGALSHLGVSAIYGMFFGVLLAFLLRRVPPWLAGAGFGLGLFFIARLALLPGTNSPLEAISPVNLAAAHLIYGLALGVLVGKKEASFG